MIPNSESEELIDYIENLKEYLLSNNIPLIDFTNDLRIKEEHFKNGDHLNENGRIVFTKMIYEQLLLNSSSLTNQAIKLKNIDN